MLNKKVCHYCMGDGSHPTRQLGWFDMDEGNWDAGYVSCPYLQKSPSGMVMVYKQALREEEPPAWCSYILEHIILGQKKFK